MKDPLRQTKYLMSETDQARIPASRAEVTFVGRSNVGKSSTICALCDNYSLAQVSKTPGRTRGINVYEAAFERWLVDLPGYGYAQVAERQRDYWPKMIGTYLSQRPNLTCVFVLVDAERGLGPIDIQMVNWLREKTIPHTIVGTKVDKVGGSRQLHARTQMAKSAGLLPAEIQWISAKKGYGLPAFRQVVIKALGI